jgi:uncharacterized protein (TIRG00374 family)
MKVTLPLLLGIVILYFLYRKTDFNELWAYIKGANWSILLFSLIFGLAGNLIRSLRWKILITPLGYRPKTSNVIYSVLGSYAVNFAIPRAGEIWRCGMLSKEEKIPFTKLIGTLIIDRLFDVVMVALFIAAAFVTNWRVFEQNREAFDLPDWMVSPVFYAGCFAVLALVVGILFIFRKNKFIGRINRFFIEMGKDFAQVWRMKKKMRFIAYSFGIWICYFFYFYITFYAFDFTAGLGWAAGLFVFTVGSISMVIPSNGGLGPWQAAVVFALCAFFVSVEQATAFATAVFAVQTLWVVACGLFGIAMISLKKTE